MIELMIELDIVAIEAERGSDHEAPEGGTG